MEGLSRYPNSSLEETLLNAKEWIVHESGAYEDGNSKFKQAAEEFTLDALRCLKQDTEAMRRIDTKPALFAAFADLETAFEPIEKCLSDLLAAIDEAVDLEVQSARGR